MVIYCTSVLYIYCMVLSTTWQIWYMIWSSSHVPSIGSIYLIYSFGTYMGHVKISGG